MPMNVSDLSTCYTVRALLPEDAERVLPLLRGNEIFYHYHPPEPTLASICEDMAALPPGKTLQSLSLLSGGEQTLTALSLIFAIFLSNPSPICVLDEVDAPLDDANIERFCNLMDEMTKLTETRFLMMP